MENLLAIVDLGTNTFHLLAVAMTDERGFTILDRKQIPVKLGRNGIGKSKISRSAFNRGIRALEKFREIIHEHQISELYVVGTSALRNADNAPDFITECEKILQAPVSVIEGDKEASYIYYGVRWALGLWNNPSLIMDIGGGSVEFILADKFNIFWKESYEIGAARIIGKYPHHFPPKTEEVKEIEKFLEEKLTPLFEWVSVEDLQALIGASGSFETFASIEIKNYLDIETGKLPLMHPIQIKNFRKMKEMILQSSREELLQVQGMASFRVDMIVVSVILTNLIIEKLKFSKIFFSSYALKEGVLWDLIKQKKFGRQ